MTVEAVNPATGETVSTHPELDADAVAAAARRAHDAFRSWRDSSFETRAAVLRRAAELLRESSATLAELMATEMGKVLAEGRSEADKCAWVCEYYADHGEAFLAPEPIESDAQRSFVAYRPLGVLLAIMPWNFPFWQVFRAAAPALMAGNTVLLKHAPSVPGCALAIESLLREAGLPEGAFQTLLCDIDRVPELIGGPHVQAVTLTGSTRAGKAVAAQAGAALLPVVLELGGSDPYVILEDADIEYAVERCAISRLINGGQSCIAAKRLIVVDAVREAFEARLTERLAKVTVGDPFDASSDIGPMARVDLRDTLHRQVEESVAAGARCVLGGTKPEGPGAFYPVTLLTDPPAESPAYREELFGPVAVIIGARDQADALRIANDTSYGLGAAVFTADIERGAGIARDTLDAGACFVNDFVRSDPRLPFGGIKESGFGRELARPGIRSFVNVKTVYIARTSANS
jgi:succinate-semialdehyde dehydrogenase/glutarate-semialdehyde dehydrogenase